MRKYYQVGKALRVSREHQDLRQVAAAEMLGCSSSYLSEIEAGKKRPGLSLAARIEKLFGVSALAWTSLDAHGEVA